MIRSQKVRDAARSETCTLQIAGVCNFDPETTILAHLPHETHGMALKASDLSACFACSDCHDVIDNRVPGMLSQAEREWYMRRAMVRTLERLVEKGIVRVL